MPCPSRSCQFQAHACNALLQVQMVVFRYQDNHVCVCVLLCVVSEGTCVRRAGVLEPTAYILIRT
jgi:hypothetical protein